MDRLVELIQSGEIHKIIVLTGAGISVAAGIPDFRSPKIGLYASVKEMKHLRMRSPTFVFDISVFKSDPRPFWWIFGRLWPRSDWPNPTPFHYFLTLLERHNLLLRCYTQNIDDLETLAGLSHDKIVNCHGVLSPCHCLDCKKEVSLAHCIEAIKPNIEKNIDDYEEAVVPICPFCHQNHVKPDVVFFGQNLPRSFNQYSSDLPSCDLLIVSGTSLEVSPVSELPSFAKDTVPRFLINRDKVKSKGNAAKEWWNKVKTAFTFGLKNFSSEFDFDSRDSFIGGDLQDAALELINRLGWKDEYEALKQEAENSEHPLHKLLTKEQQQQES
ncbi:NAD-dependent protein deacetylase sirtuin-2 [Tritrichomonas foetus]|uniref:NAD-dependent protein deacetylase sirtuin-2 n=1 Tax=Tritrichomonas foetus TaxID=1144522 RepID=A0A1J4KVG1_9EUKA|nr:NAD-dependent protein deacetylase sirtuin-2 [Tritrichomonas foetus]|eukprot:OHT13724.1 NAD-dependent protein deacetylase sirtuin-2 [Tritrichomonas foetus]